MADLTTHYMGLELKNPIIIGSCNLVTDIDYAKSLEDAGASALVYKTLFEEQINLESAQLDDMMHEYDHINAEMSSLYPSMEHAGPKEHLLGIKILRNLWSCWTSSPVLDSLRLRVKE